MMEDNDVDVGGSNPEEPSEVEQEALRQGWSPQDKFHGKPEDWVDAETFVTRGREINAVLKKQLDASKRELASLKSEMAGMKGTVAELAAYRQDLEKKVYDRAMVDLKTQLKAARSEGNFELAADVEEAIDGMKDQAPKAAPVPTPAPQVEPREFTAWKGRNPWYNSDTNPKMVQYADGVAIHAIQSIQRNEGRQPTPQEILVQVDEAVREMFPQAFNFQPASMVEGGNGSGGSSSIGKSAKGFSSLPAEDKAQFEKFYKAGYYIDMATRKPLSKAEAQAEYFKDY